MKGLADEDRERLFEILTSMKANLVARSAGAVERRASHG
jgi:hypothetical protein